MEDLTKLIIFTVSGHRFALSPYCVEHVMSVIEVTPLPGAPSVIEGVINLYGRIIPIINLRRRLGIPEREMALTDKFIIAMTARRTIGLMVDTASPVVDFDSNSITPSDEVMPGIGNVTGIARTVDGMVIINDIDKFLSIDEDAAIDDAISGM